MNAVEIEQAITDLAELPFEPAEFPYAFLEAFGNKETTLKRLRAGASTYLLAKVEVVATYKLAGINRSRMEGLFHKLFAPARLDITIQDRFGRPVQPEEWFLIPLFVIDEAVARIKDGSITAYTYDPKAAKLVKT